MSQLWILKSKGEESAFGGNSGYADKPMSQYVYDTNVINHDKLNVGDPVVVANKKFIIGYAKIISIKIRKRISKKRYRCPVCNTQEHYSRKGQFPKYKCRKKHEFDRASP